MAPPGNPRYPDFFIVGSPRCGTTFLWDALRAQPQLFLPEPKEPHYFAEDLDHGTEADARQRVRNLDTYLALFAAARPDQLSGEGSTSSLLSAVAVPRILEANPGARLIVSLRDPIEQIGSMHARWRAAGIEQFDLESALRLESERATWPAPARVPMFWGTPRYRAPARYGEQLERLFRTAPRDQVLVLTLDDIRADPLATVTRVTRFLGVPDPAPFPELERNASREPRSRALLELVWSPRFIGAAKAVVPRRLRPVARRAAERAQALNRREAQAPAVPLPLRRQLQHELRADLELASGLLGDDLVRRWWADAG